jgi:non-specific serine/threonine protein kinase
MLTRLWTSNVCAIAMPPHFELAERAEPGLRGPGQLTWLTRLEKDRPNLHAALARSIEAKETETAARFCSALHHFWVMHGYLSQGRLWAERAASLASQPTGMPPDQHLRLLNGAGSLAYYMGDYVEARAYFSEALAIAQNLQDDWGMAYALDGLAVRPPISEKQIVRSSCRNSLSISTGLDERWLRAITLINLGELARAREDFSTAARSYEESLRLLHEAGDKLFTATVLHDMGQLAQDQEEFERAEAIHLQSLSLSQELGSRRNVAACLEKLAGVACRLRKAQRAACLLGAAERLRQLASAPMLAVDRPDHNRCIGLARSQMGEADFAFAWTRGHGMDLEHAIAYAMAGETE